MPIPDNYKAPVVLSAKERAFEQLQTWIIDGTLQPGERINDIDIAKAIGISRTPVREALQVLALQGFVSMKPGVATTIKEIDPADLEKLLPPLAALEGLAAALAVQHVQLCDTEYLMQLNAAFSEALRQEDTHEALKIDDQFHSAIVRLSRNSYIESMTTMLQAHVRRFFFHQSVALALESANEHAHLIQALRSGAADEAEYWAKNNWLRPIRSLENR